MVMFDLASKRLCDWSYNSGKLKMFACLGVNTFQTMGSNAYSVHDA